MRVEPQTITYSQPERITAGELAGKIQSVTHTESVFLRSMKYRKRVALLTALRGDAPMREVTDDKGNVGMEIDPKEIPLTRDAEYQVQVIVNTVCDAAGKLVLTDDDVDDWSDQKRKAYMDACRAFQNPTVEDAAKNFSSTETAAT